MEKELECLPLCFLPPAFFFEKILSEKQIYISLGERYKKQTLRNRFSIVGANNIQTLTLPVIHPGNYTRVAEIKLDNSENWQMKHQRSIESAYRKAPFFEYYYHLFEPLFQKKFALLAELNLDALHTVLKIFNADTQILLSMDYQRTLDIKQPTSYCPYFQVFEERHGFMANMSILDLIFNEGPSAPEFLKISKP